MNVKDIIEVDEEENEENEEMINAKERQTIFSEDTEPDSYHWHEALDRMHFIFCIFDDFIYSHLVIRNTDELKELANNASDALFRLYNKIGEMIDAESD